MYIYLFPVDGVWFDWTEWSICNVTCGGGGQFSIRDCDGPFYGGSPCTGEAIKRQNCGSDPCPGEINIFNNLHSNKIIKQTPTSFQIKFDTVLNCPPPSNTDEQRKEAI